MASHRSAKRQDKEALAAAMEKASSGAALTEAEHELLAESEAEWDAVKAQQHAEQDALAKQPPGKPTHVHRQSGLVEVLKKNEDDWLYRGDGDAWVDRAPSVEFRAIITAKEATALAARLGKSQMRAVPPDSARRARLRSPTDLLDLPAIERDFLYFAELVAAGAVLWTMEQGPFQRLRQVLMAEVALVLGKEIDLPEVL